MTDSGVPSGLREGTSLLIVATVGITIRHFLAPYAAHFRALGWRVEAAASRAADDPVLHEAFDAVHELPLSRSLKQAPGLLRGFRRISALLDRGPSIVHVHTPIAAFLVRAAARRIPPQRRPLVVYTAHGFHFHQGGSKVSNALFLTAERAAGRWTDRLVVINDEDEVAARRHRIVPPRRLVRMPGIGIDTGRWSPASVSEDEVARFREGLGIPAGTPAFVVVGELNRNKRQRDVMNALAMMRSRDAHLMLLGKGADHESLEALVVKLGLADRVHLAGFIADPRPAVRGATALILPSQREGLARSVMEALALEVPVIASTARGNRELLGPDSGILFTTGDVAALASAMDRLIEHPDAASAMGRCGRQRMVAEYRLDILIGMHEALYRGMLAERARRGR